MKKPQSFPIFGDAYLADTTHLTTEEHGAYFLLLLAAWRQDDCCLPDDPKKLARIAGVTPQKWKSMSATIMEFWTLKDGRIFQSRQRKEREWVEQKREGNRENSVRGWKKRRGAASGKQTPENKQSTTSDRNAKRMRNGCETDAPPPPPPPPPLEEPNGSSPPYTPPAKRKSRCPDDFHPSVKPGSKTALKMREWSQEHLETQIEKFIAHHQGKGNTSTDWNKQWTTWALNDYDRGASRNGNGNHNNSGSGLFDACADDARASHR